MHFTRQDLEYHPANFYLKIRAFRIYEINVKSNNSNTQCFRLHVSTTSHSTAFIIQISI
jgi:hypothetical protein